MVQVAGVFWMQVAFVSILVDEARRADPAKGTGTRNKEQGREEKEREKEAKERKDKIKQL